MQNGEKRRLFDCGGEAYIEGIGCIRPLGGLMHYLSVLELPTDGSRSTQLNLFLQDGKVLYKAPDYEGDPARE